MSETLKHYVLFLRQFLLIFILANILRQSESEIIFPEKILSIHMSVFPVPVPYHPQKVTETVAKESCHLKSEKNIFRVTLLSDWNERRSKLSSYSLKMFPHRNAQKCPDTPD